MNAIHSCPPPELIRSLLDGLLSAGEEARLTAHVDGCESCQALVERLGRSLQEEFRLPASHAAEPLAESLRRAMQGLKSSPVQELTTAELPPPSAPQVPVSLTPSYEGWLGPYEIKGVIGRGGMGVVLKAFDPSLHRLVAIKVLAPHLANCPTSRRRFAREGRAAAAISHEHVVAVHGVHEADGLPYLVMEFVPGISLQERLDREGPLEVRAILRIGIQVAAGLAAAHAQGLIHRDIKPGNILLENEVERIKITDFGLARAADDATLTQSGVLAGTPEYMAPEQARGETVDHRADLFSLGSVLYAMSTGRPPFRAGSALAVLHCICMEEPAPIQELNSDIPEWLCILIALLHAKDRAARFTGAAEVARLLRQYLTHLEQPGTQPRPPRLTWRGIARLRRLAWPLMFVACAGLLLAGGVLLRPHLGSLRPLAETAPPVAETAQQPSFTRQPATRTQPQPVYSAAFAPEGDVFATGCGDRSVRLWDRRTFRPLRILDGHQATVWSVAFSPNGRRIASAAGDWSRASSSGELRLWDAADGQLLLELAGSPGIFFSVAFSSDGRTLAAANWDHSVHLWDPDNGKEKAVLRGHSAPVRAVAFTPDGRILVSGSFDGCIKLWDMPGGECLATLQGPPCRINALALSPDGKILAVAENPADSSVAQVGSIRLWSMETRREIAVLHGHEGRALSVQFAPDGRTLVSGGGDRDQFGEVLLWDTRARRLSRRLPGPREWVECVEFSPDGRLLISAGGTPRSGGEIKLWE
jgi:serine/threonine protein kinase